MTPPVGSGVIVGLDETWWDLMSPFKLFWIYLVLVSFQLDNHWKTSNGRYFTRKPNQIPAKPLVVSSTYGLAIYWIYSIPSWSLSTNCNVNVSSRWHEIHFGVVPFSLSPDVHSQLTAQSVPLPSRKLSWPPDRAWKVKNLCELSVFSNESCTSSPPSRGQIGLLGDVG